MAFWTHSWAALWPSNFLTSTFLFSSALQSLKKRCTWSRMCCGSSLMSSKWDTDMSPLATAIILSSSSPWSIMCITPITFASTMHRGSIATLQITRMSKGSWSSQQVIGMNPQFAGQCTALNSTRSSFRSPVSLWSSYLALELVGISITAFTDLGASSPTGQQCQGFFANFGFIAGNFIQISFFAEVNIVPTD